MCEDDDEEFDRFLDLMVDALRKARLSNQAAKATKQ
jgi:hypothetical protein